MVITDPGFFKNLSTCHSCDQVHFKWDNVKAGHKKLTCFFVWIEPTHEWVSVVSWLN